MAKTMHARRDSARGDGELSVEALQRRAEELEIEIEAAAVRGDADLFVHLQMTRAALPRRIREAKAAPVRVEIERLEDELEDRDAEVQRVQDLGDEELPDSPYASAEMVRNRMLGGARERQSETAKELTQEKRHLKKIERGDELEAKPGEASAEGGER